MTSIQLDCPNKVYEIYRLTCLFYIYFVKQLLFKQIITKFNNNIAKSSFFEIMIKHVLRYFKLFVLITKLCNSGYKTIDWLN